MKFRYLAWMGGACMDIGAAAGGAAQAAGAVAAATIQAAANTHAADIQVASANRSADLVQGRYDQTRGDFQPYRDLGSSAASRFTPDTIDQYGNPQQMTRGNMLDRAYDANPNAPTLTPLPPRMTQAELEQTPGYQFNLSQGQQAVASSAAARGLGVSGAALKGAATFATGLADNTYQAQFAQQQQLFSDAVNQNQLQFANQQQRFGNLTGLNTANQGNLQSSFNRLSGLTGIGTSSAAQTGAIGNASANQAGQLITGGANAAAAGMIAGGNATAGGINSIANAFGQYQMQNRLSGNSGSNSMYGGNGVSSQFMQKDDPFGGAGGAY